MNRKAEQRIQLAISDYIRIQYPQVAFTSEAGGGKKSMHQAILSKRLRSGNGLPDLIVMHPAGSYHGLMLELKAEGIKVRKKDGTLVSNPHIQQQAKVLQGLRDLGYFAEFACGFEEAKKFIDGYMALALK